MLSLTTSGWVCAHKNPESPHKKSGHQQEQITCTWRGYMERKALRLQGKGEKSSQVYEEADCSLINDHSQDQPRNQPAEHSPDCKFMSKLNCSSF